MIESWEIMAKEQKEGNSGTENRRNPESLGAQGVSYREGWAKVRTGELYYREYGAGKPLLLIHGAMCDADFYGGTAGVLSGRYRVFTYDRWGYSRSKTGVPPDQLGVESDNFWVRQAQDAAALLEQVCPGEKAVVVGTSAGAIIAMHLLALRPELVEYAIFYEPPLVPLLPEEHEALASVKKISELIDQGKITRAINRFLLLMGDSDEMAPPKTPEMLDHAEGNMDYFIRHEYKAVFSAMDLPQFQPGSRFCIGAGDRHREDYHYQLAHVFAKRYHCPVVHFPGVHNCAYDLPQDFAVGVAGILALA